MNLKKFNLGSSDLKLKLLILTTPHWLLSPEDKGEKLPGIGKETT